MVKINKKQVKCSLSPKIPDISSIKIASVAFFAHREAKSFHNLGKGTLLLYSLMN